MRKSILLAAAAVALVPAFASQHVMAGSTAVVANKAVVCEVNNLPTDITFTAFTTGTQAPTTPHNITISCNDQDGGTLKIESENTGLTTGAETLDYKAVVDSTSITGLPLTLDTSSFSFVTVSLAGSPALAGPASPNATLQLELLTSAVFGGNYADTLIISISPNT